MAWWARCGLNVNSQWSLTLYTPCSPIAQLTRWSWIISSLRAGTVSHSSLISTVWNKMLIKCTSQGKHILYKVIFQTCMSKEIFLDGEKKPSHCPSMELNTIVTIYLRQPWSDCHSSIRSSYWKHNTERNARWVSKDNWGGMRHFHTSPLRTTGRLTDQTLN